eukprot:1104982-Rhodomonas_salina.1
MGTWRRWPRGRRRAWDEGGWGAGPKAVGTPREQGRRMRGEKGPGSWGRGREGWRGCRKEG